MQLCRHYFGPEAKIYGVDINPNCKQFAEPGVQIFIGDQQDRAFLRTLAHTIPAIDILIDAGGHTMDQQIHTYEELFPKVAANGVYLIEALHTSYSKDYGGAYKAKNTFIEYSKDFVDQTNAWHSQQPDRLDVSDFTRSVNSLHYYDSVLVIEKRPTIRPTHERKGTAFFLDYVPPTTRPIDKIKSLFK
jgi:hypothetical protein